MVHASQGAAENFTRKVITFRPQKEIVMRKYSVCLAVLLGLMLLEAAESAAISATCLRAPLPINPGTPNYSVTHEVLGERMLMVFWREVCADGTGVALLMKATPLVGSPFLCSAAFTVIQNGVQHNYIDLEPAPGSDLGWCNDLLVPITLIVTEYQFGQAQFDPAQALTVIYDFIIAVRLDIP